MTILYLKIKVEKGKICPLKFHEVIFLHKEVFGDEMSYQFCHVIYTVAQWTT